jgi:hypothetical protein
MSSSPTLAVHAMLLPVEGELMDLFLQEFANLFQEPTGLPPEHTRSHQI